MVYQYVLGGVLVSLLGSVLFMIINSTLRGKKKVEDVSEDVNGNGFVRMQPANGGCLPEIEKSTDVVIVGAGVAGAAFAYPLGKLTMSASNSLDLDVTSKSDGRNYAVGYEKQSNVANHGNQQIMEINRFSLRNPLNNLGFVNFARILTLTVSTSVHDILAFVIPTLLTFVQMTYPNENLFKTHPVAMNIVLYTLLAYSFAFGVRHRFLKPDNPYPWFHMAMLLFGPAALASLLSLVFPNYYSSWLPMLCVLGVLLLFGWLLLGLTRNLWRQIEAQIRRRQRQYAPRPLRAIRRRVRMPRPLLPLAL